MAGKSKGKGVRNSRSLRFLFASGILRGSGSGKDRSVSYNAKRARSIAGQRKRGVDVTRKYRNTPKGSTRPVIGGSKAARLRGGGGSGKVRSPLSREERITAGLRVIKNNPQVARKVAKAREMKWEGRDKKQVAAVVNFRGRDKRIAAGRAKLQEFRAAQEAKNQAAYGGGLFKSRASRPDYSSTRAQRIAAGKSALATFGKSPRGKAITKAIKAIDSNSVKIDQGLKSMGLGPSAARVPKLVAKNRELASSAGLKPRSVAKLLKRLNR